MVLADFVVISAITVKLNSAQQAKYLESLLGCKKIHVAVGNELYIFLTDSSLLRASRIWHNEDF